MGTGTTPRLMLGCQGGLLLAVLLLGSSIHAQNQDPDIEEHVVRLESRQHDDQPQNATTTTPSLIAADAGFQAGKSVTENNQTLEINSSGLVPGNSNLTMFVNETGTQNRTVNTTLTSPLNQTSTAQNATGNRVPEQGVSIPANRELNEILKHEQAKQDSNMRINSMAKHRHNASTPGSDDEPEPLTSNNSTSLGNTNQQAQIELPTISIADVPVVQIIPPQQFLQPAYPPLQPSMRNSDYPQQLPSPQQGLAPLAGVFHQAEARAKYQDSSDSLDPNSLSSSSDSSGSSSGFSTSSGDCSGSSDSSSSSSPSSNAPPRDAPGGSPTELSESSSTSFDSSSSSTSSLDSSQSSSDSSGQSSGSVDSVGSISDASSQSSGSSNPTISVVTSFASSMTAEFMQQGDILQSSSV